ncbi:GNAT family N-acetyltransferase [Streptomyces sp. QHH-9511]|uniref:GNAT family N-acetyltransferase n=1 Tax=Streptomyces sp. QHH-9511 TaxID=2684468 RepID=UPI0013183814|nr:GNAT family N-acetyltransferase [Streptomyces sp. QHH-9511]QGZ50139.1 GNAT family N-acetyltransferase [Streptomyces sp. QHH-9511]
MSLEVRAVVESEYPDWLRAVSTGFLRPPVVTDEEVADRLPHTDLSRLLGVFEQGRIVATFRSFTQELSAVGGGTLVADAVTGVTVSATHRRRGLLSRMMARDLAAAKERGDAVATLIAAEYPIYGRFGFGPATWTTEWTVDVRRAGLDPRRSGRPEDGGRIDFTDAEEIRKVAPELHRRLGGVRAGIVGRDARGWDVLTGRVHHSSPWTEPFYAVYRDEADQPQGYVSYTCDDKWEDGKQPLNTATVKDLIAVTPAAERALWLFLCSVDWVTAVKSGMRAPDDLLPLLLPDPRAARVTTQADMLWVRVLDVAKVLEGRTYAGSGTLVLDLRDATGLAGGRYRLDASPEGATCSRTTESPDLAFDIGELGTLSLGDESAVRLAALGRVEEIAPGAAARADALLRTSRRPWCPDIF